MAGNAARRIGRAGLICLVFLTAALAGAEFGAASFCRLSPDRLAIFAGADRFLLKRDAAWVVADPKQAPKFKAWREKAALPADLGVLVTGLPKTREVPKLGDLSLSGDDKAKTVDFGLSAPLSVRLLPAEGGWIPDAEGAKAFAAAAAALGQKPPTLLVTLADAGGEISESKAWKKFLDRFAAPEFVVMVGNRKGVLWAHGGSKPVTPTQSGSNPASAETKPVQNGKAREAPQETVPIWVWAVLGILAAGNLALGWMVWRTRRPEEAASPISHHERQLLEKVREEAAKRSTDPRSEEKVVGRMLESFDGYEAVERERNELATYKQFQENFQTFDRQAQEIKRVSEERRAEIAALTDQLKRERAAQSNLQKELALANDTSAALRTEIKAAEHILDEVGAWQRSFDSRLEEVAGLMRDE